MRSTMVRSVFLVLLVVPLGACAADGERHVHDDSHSHGGPPGGDATGPSAAARMVCAGQVVDGVTRIMAFDRAVEPESAWKAPEFTCTFPLPGGPLVLSVHDASDPTAGEAHFHTRRAGVAEAVPIRGVSSLGLPAYETPDGTVAFVKDGKTLEADASALSDELVSRQDLTRTEIAYAVASSVLACWTEHG